MARRSRALEACVYLLVRLLVCFVQMLSWRAALGLARVLAWLGWRLDGRHRRIAQENLRHAFPEVDDNAIDRLTRATYEHFATMLVEIIRLPRVLTLRTIDRHVHYADPADYDRVLAWLNSDRPLIVMTGHFGNWEIFSYLTGLLGFRASVVARRLDNPLLDRFLLHFRRKTGQEILDKNEDYDRILSVLKEGKFLGMVGDQDAGARGLFVNFLGRPASTFKSIALLSLSFGAPILVFGAARDGHPMKYRLYFEDVILPEEFADVPDAPRAITDRYTAALERLVRRHPEQYFWLHRRWKHQPVQRKAKKAA